MKESVQQIIVLFLLPLLAGCTIFSRSLQSDASARALYEDLQAQSQVIDRERYLEILPEKTGGNGSETRELTAKKGQAARKAGLIFYPGGKVEEKAYLPLLDRISRAGYPVFLVKMPLDLALFRIDGADQVIADHPEIREWALAGHSLGGAMACEYLKKGDKPVKKLILLAAYPADNTDLSALSGLQVLSLSAEMDYLASREEIKAGAWNLPPGTRFIEIPGGNHAGFGSYGVQEGDGKALISPREQQRLTAEYVEAFLEGFFVDLPLASESYPDTDLEEAVLRYEQELREYL